MTPEQKRQVASMPGAATSKYFVVADASLFFCPPAEFAGVWSKIYECLNAGGVFCGSFLGPEDTMAGPAYSAADYWHIFSVVAKKPDNVVSSATATQTQQLNPH